MFTEILKIVPKVDQSGLNQMERSLTTRFQKIAKGFGKGLKAAVTGGGIATLLALAGSAIDKLLNPLKETQEAIDRILGKADDISTNAKQFGTTSGKLFKLQQFGVANGLDPEALSVLIGKFQAAVAEAKADPKKDTSVRKFAGMEDMAEGFFEFIQGIQKLPKAQQVLVQQEVFGEKQILKMSDFMNSDFGPLQKRLKLKDSTAYTPGIEKLADINDRSDEYTAMRNAKDMETKGRIINMGMASAKNASEQRALNQENKRIESYQDLKRVSELSEKIANSTENGYLFMLKELSGALDVFKSMLTAIETLGSTLISFRDKVENSFFNSRFWRGITGKDK